MNKRRLQIGIVISVLFSAVVLYFVVRDMDWTAAWSAIREMKALNVVIAVLFLGLGLVARGLRFHYLMRGQLPLRRSLNLTHIAFFVNNVLPFRAGDIARIELSAHGSDDESAPRAVALSVAVVERLIDLISLMVLFVLAIATLPTVPEEVQNAVVGFGIFTVVGSLGVLLVGTVLQGFARNVVKWFEEKIPLLERIGIGKFAENILDGLAVVRSPRFLGLGLFWNVAAWVASYIAYHATAAALFDDVTFGLVMLILVAVAFAISIPVTVASIGAIEAGVVIAMTSQGYEYEPSFAIGLVIHAATLAAYAVLGVTSLWLETLSLATIWSTITQADQKPQESQAV